jgi:hypothetical protein
VTHNRAVVPAREFADKRKAVASHDIIATYVIPDVLLKHPNKIFVTYV